jgi:hypothetical protein
MKTQLPIKLFTSIIIMIFSAISKPGMAQEIVKPSGVFQIQKRSPAEIKNSVYKLPSIKEFEIEGKRFFKPEKNSSSELSNTITVDNATSKNTCANPPLLGTNFEGNPLTPFYLPPVGYYASESNIAISNSGKIVSISNSWIRYYNENGTMVFSDSLYHFCSGLIDVHVIYDPKKDRFVFISSYGITDFLTVFQGLGIMIAFSKTNDPMDGWNFYYLPDSIFNDNREGDYPLLGINDDDVFITYIRYSKGNALNRCAIVQADKNAGYTGATLNTQVYSVQSSIGTIVPAPGGSTTYGPNMFFVSALEESHASNTYTVYEITNSLASGKAVLKKYDKISSNITYTPALTSYQPGGIPLTDLFADIDDYMQNAFYENGVLQFCQNTNINGKAAVCLGRITGIPNNISCTAKTISDPDLYFSYPCIAYAGMSSSDNSAIVSFEHTGLNTFPGLSAVSVNSNFDISPVTIIKAGNDTINALWGDYSGICRRYNHPGEVWYEGQYGSTTFPNINWIAQLKKQQCASEQIADVTEVKAIASSKNIISVFPNPFSNSTAISFTIQQSQTAMPAGGQVSITIYDINGRLIKVLANEQMQPGNHQLIWNAKDEKGSPVVAGVYLLKLQTGNYTEVKKMSLVK